MSSEARTGKRFPLELPIKIHGKRGDDSATTANMSAAGVYIMADLDLNIGSSIEFDITLPAKVLGTPTMLGSAARGESSAKMALPWPPQPIPPSVKKPRAESPA